MAAVILAFAMTECIALSAVSDLVSNFLSLVVMVIARIILQFCDLIMNPLLEITQMTTEEVAHYIPGFAMSGNGIGGYFSQAIMVISTTIAGALIAVRIISYLMETADGARTESVPKLIWNAVFGMVLTLTGSHFLQLMFDEIISPLTTALSEGVTGGGLGEFSFEDSGMKIIGQTESGDAAGTIVAWMGGFSIVEGASLVVSIVFLFLIWWNLIKLVLECAERYIICVFTILLSPLAFATATNERTKDTAVNWMQMFWSQCVLLILNIWVVGIARTALNIGLVGASVESVVKWGLVTYAYLKIAQKLDDMLAKAGFRITSTTGLDPMSEAAGAFRIIAGAAHDALDLAGSVAGHGRAAADAVGNVVGGAGSNSKPIDTNPAAAAGANGAATGAASNLDKYGKVSFGDKEKADRFVRGTNAERSDMYKNSGETFNSNSNRQAMANALDELGFDGGKVSQGTVEDLAPDNAIKGAVNGKVTYRDENGKITGVSGFRYSSDESGTTATKTSDLAISPDGQSAILTTDKGKFRLENTGRTAANGSQEWTATRMTDGKGRSLGDVIPDTKNSTSFSVPAGQLNKYGADGAAAIAARSAMESKNLDYLTRITDSALSKHDQEQAAVVTRNAKQAEAQKQFDTAKGNYSGRFQMSNEQRAAEMRNPDSAVDYNSSESLAAMQDTLANADPELAEQFAKGAKVTGIDMAMGRDDMPDGALTVTVSDGNTTDTYMVSNPKGSLTDEEAAQVIASGRLPKGTAEGTGASENVTGDAGNATMVDGDATAKETDATAPDENGQIAYNSLADDDSGQEVTGAEVGDTVGMTPEAFEATHTPVAAMDEPEPEATSFWGRVASVFSGHHGNSESSEPGVVNPDTVAQGGTTDAVPTGSGVPTPQTATATTTATGATGSANAANTANGTTINANSSAGATAAGGTASRPVGANNVNVVNPDAVANSSGSTRAASTPAGAPTANGTADSKPINAANVTVTGASAPGNASGTSTNVPQAKSGNGTPTNATVEGSATPLVHEGNAPISGGGTATNKGAGPVIASTPEAVPAGKNGAAPEQGISTVPAGGNGAAPATTPTPETAPTAEGQGNVPSANVNTVGEDNTAPAGTAGTTATKAAAPVLSNAGTLPTEATTSGSETAVAPGTQAQNVSAKPAPGSEPQSESEISAGGNGATGEGNTVVIASPAQGGNAPQTKDAAPSGHVEMETSADSSVTSTVTQSAGEDSVTNSSATQTETVVDGTGAFSESSVGSAIQAATDKTVTEEGPAPTTTPASPDSSDFAANDSTVSVESPAGSAPGEEFAGPAEQTTSYGSADAEFGGSNTPSDIGVVNESAGSTGSETQLMDDGSDAVQTHAPAQFESATGAAVNDSVTGDASADYAEPLADAGKGAVTENSGSTDFETQFANDSSAAVQTHTPASQADDAATNDNVSDDASVDYAEPPANADNAFGGSAAPVVQHTDNEPAVGESDDSDTSSGYVGGTEDVGSADVDASPMDGDSATVETQAPASYADRTVDTDDEAAGNAGSDYAEPPADAGGASNDVAASSAQRTDSDDVSGEGNTGFAGGNGGGDNYSSDEETAPTAQGVKAPADEDDSGIGEPPAKGESSSNVGAVAGHAAPFADGDGDDFDDNDVGSASFGGSNGSSHDENPDSDASSGSGEETSNDDATAPTVQHQNVGNNSHDDGSSSDDNGGTTVSAHSTPAPEIQGGGAVSSESAGSDYDGSASQTAPAASVTENTAPAKATPKTTAEASRAEDNPAPAAQNFNQGGVGEDTGDSGDADGSAARKQPAEKPPVDGTQFYADTSRSNSFTEAGTFSDNAGVSSAEPNTSGASNGPEIRPLSHLSIKAFNDTNGFVESDGIGRIQVTRVSVDPDTGITQWRIMQKLDADGNVPETPDVMNIERSAKYNKQTRRYEPETFEGIARQLGKVDDYESVGPDTDESYKRRSQNPKQVKPQSNVRSDVQPQQKNAYEGKSFRERNTRNERNERNNRFQQMMQGNKSHNGSKSKKDKPSK
jgi:cell wall surface anchor family protein